MKNLWILLLLVFLGACAHTAPQQEPEEAEASIEDFLNDSVPPDIINPWNCAPFVYYITDEQCRASAFCVGFGECSSNDEFRCIATSDADCAASELCASDGYCTLRDGMCVLE